MATKNVVSWQDGDTPITGLSPTFTHFARVHGDVDVDPPDVTELREGFYVFEFTALEPHYFVLDGGDSISDPGIRYIRGVLEPTNNVAATLLDEALAILQNDSDFVVEGGETYQVVYRDGQPFKKWRVFDQNGRRVNWPDTSQLPVGRVRVL